MPAEPHLQPPCCRIDTDGHVYDVAGLSPALSHADTSRVCERLKLFHRKRQQRMQMGDMDTETYSWGQEFSSGTTTPTTMDFGFERKCSIDSDGILHMQPDTPQRQRSCSIDTDGVVYNLEAMGDYVPPSPSDRLKKFYRKKMSRCQGYDEPMVRLRMDDTGRIQGWEEVSEDPLIVPLDLECC